MATPVYNKVQGFGGMIPAVDQNLLADSQASLSQNCWTYSGALAGMNTPKLLRALTGGTAITKVYRIPTSFADKDHLSFATWLEFADADTNVVRTPVVGDTFERYYWVAPSQTAQYNTKARIVAGNTGANAPFTLGIPAPGSAPSISIAGGSSGTNRTTAYVYTWVSAYGEEGPVSAPTTATGKVDATWTITLTTPASTDLGTTRNLTQAKIYRTVTSASGVATYFYVATVAIGAVLNGNTHTNTTIDGLSRTDVIGTSFTVTGSGVAANTTVSTIPGSTSVTVNNATSSSLTATPITFTPVYADANTDTTVSANSQLTATNWIAPPTDLQGWVALPNGIIAGFRANEVWFSEPYRPHAWPALYALAVDYPIVGLGVHGQTLVVATQSYPYAIAGIHPASMTQSRMASIEPCLSRNSIVSAPEGVYYASSNGLIRVSNGQAVNITQNLITKDQWFKQTGTTVLATLRAARLGGAYYAFGSVRAGVFETTAFYTSAFTQQDYTGAYTGMLIDPANQRVAFNVLSNTVPCVNVMNDPWSGELFIIRNGNLYWIDISDTAPTYETFKWRSKIWHMPYQRNLGALKVYFDTISTTPALNPTPNSALTQTLAADQWGLVRCYADGILKWTRELRTSGELMRLPSGFKASYYQFEFESRLYIKSFQFAASAKELANV